MHTVPGVLRGLPRLAAEGVEDNVAITLATRARSSMRIAAAARGPPNGEDHFDQRAVDAFALSVGTPNGAAGFGVHHPIPGWPARRNH